MEHKLKIMKETVSRNREPDRTHGSSSLISCNRRRGGTKADSIIDGSSAIVEKEANKGNEGHLSFPKTDQSPSD